MKYIVTPLLLAALALMTGCGDNVKKTKKVTIIEEEPVRMVSPGEEVVE
jgi:hypothetical protein